MFHFIPITAINDFLFCPRSLYFHGIYQQFDTDVYKDLPQKRGKQAHRASDEGKYSSHKRYLQGKFISSSRLGLIGRIDIYDQEEKALIERKRLIRHVYRGYRLQLLAQKKCLEEEGREVRRCFLHSLADNKRYEVSFSSEDEKVFHDLLSKMRLFRVEDFPATLQNPEKCKSCIYHLLCRQDFHE